METLALVSLWVRLFKKRRDINQMLKASKPVAAKVLAASSGQFPVELLAFAAQTSQVLVQWNLAGTEAWHRLDVRVPAPTAWVAKPDGWVGSYAERVVLEDISPERRVVLSRTTTQTREQAEVVYDAENEGADGFRYGSLRDYFAAGARAAFVTGWQRSDTTTFEPAALQPLRAVSFPSTERDDVVAALQAQGATAEEAAALWDWIGAACALVLPAVVAKAKAKSSSSSSSSTAAAADASATTSGGKPTAFKIKGGSGLSDPLVDGERVFWAFDGTISCFALDAEGKKLWSTPVGTVTSVALAGNTIVVATSTAVTWLNAETGAVVRSVDVSGVSNVVVRGDVFAVVGAFDTPVEVYVFDADGATKAKHTLAPGFQSARGIDDGVVVSQWAPPSEVDASHWLVRAGGAERQAGEARATDGVRVVVHRGHQLVVVDGGRDGAAVACGEPGTMSCAGDAIYELAPRGASLRALDANTLQERWRVAVGKYQHKAPVVVGGELLVWIDKQVHAFNVSDGSAAWVSDDTIADAPVGPQADGRWIVVRSRAGRTPTLYVLRR